MMLSPVYTIVLNTYKDLGFNSHVAKVTISLGTIESQWDYTNGQFPLKTLNVLICV